MQSLRGQRPASSSQRRAARPQPIHRARALTVRVVADTLHIGGNWVITPPRRAGSGGRARPKVKGVVHFVGGAFAGAAPQVLYPLLLDLLASAGYTVVATPYAVTFQHLEAADSVRTQFHSTLEAMRRDPELAFLVPEDKPVVGVGHSMGALLHLLVSSRHPGTTSANVIISFNNKQVADAIPIPGFMDTVAPTLAALRNSAPPLPLPVPLPDSRAVLQTLANILPPGWAGDAGQLSRAHLALDQVSAVLNEVGDGTVDFTPSPEVSRQIIQEGYCARRTPLLMVRFTEDSIDETPLMASLLRTRHPDGVRTLVLPGSHTTPCGGDLALQPAFSPLDVIAQMAKARSQSDIRRLSDMVVAFLDTIAPPAALAEAHAAHEAILAPEPNQLQEQFAGRADLQLARAVVTAVSSRR